MTLGWACREDRPTGPRSPGGRLQLVESHPVARSSGLHVASLQIPLTSLADDVVATQQAMALETGPLLLEGHSSGGVVISQAGNDPKVAGLVFVAAYAPDEGQSRNKGGCWFWRTSIENGGQKGRLQGKIARPTRITVQPTLKSMRPAPTLPTRASPRRYTPPLAARAAFRAGAPFARRPAA